MDKCWFVLKQVHYYPPSDDAIRQGTPDAPLCLGYLIPSLRHLDHVINATEFLPFERRMKPSRPTSRHDFVWDYAAEREVGLLGRASLSIAGIIPGVDATATMGALFSKKCLATEEVQDHTRRTSSIAGGWTLYMITGLVIARGVRGTKNGLQKDWSVETVFGTATMLGRRATFSADPTAPDLDLRKCSRSNG
ncbi:hypothetical protein C8A00DRAFT_36698 [Chaetomidium leptoderma]|uniref:Uncharacterized protein n=1 Tax=Chaetomidium leptoderma TaxID=669021 RepID=A0AAN6ZVS7_9PEZI|nr:hypothetical protein C8A00DRAFT_36698 [Chaetomidium leptoderma]